MSEGLFQTISETVEIADEPADVVIHCIDCSQDFTWTTGEQIFFRDKNLANPPKRCRECKKAKNRRLAAVVRKRITGEYQKIEVRALCAKCSVVTTIPFYPSQGRPVYCRDCFLDVNFNQTNGGCNGHHG